MPAQSYDPDRIAALIGSWSNNPNDAEASSAARLVRREAERAGIRPVDLFYRQDVMTALDAHLKPDHEMVHKSAVEAERQRADQAELTLANREHQMREIITDLQSQLSAALQQQAQQQAQPQFHRGALEFLSFAWGYPQWRVLAVLVVALFWAGTGVDKPWAEFFLGLLGVWLFVLWCAAEIDMSGWLLLLIKATLAAMAIFAALTTPYEALYPLSLAVPLVGTKLLNNIGERLMRITLIANFVELFR